VGTCFPMAATVREIMIEEDEEVIIGRHESGIILQEGVNTGGRNYCANCKRKIHCRVKVDRDTHVAVIINNCKNDDCECKCKTHYACRICGYLHPYGMECNRIEVERKFDPVAEEVFRELLESFKKNA